MPATLTVENSVNALENFISDISSAGNTYYFWVGKTTAWPNDLLPPTANQSYIEATSVYHDIVYGKLLNNNMVSAVANYIPWVSNTIYAQYSTTDQNLFTENFYVTTPDMSVYKCIDNNNGNPSTTQPSLKPIVGCFQSSDGYTWKYMFTIPSASNSTFTTSSYIPITPNSAIITGAVPGTIDVIRVAVQGTNYQGYNEGLIRNVVSSQQIELANTASSIDQFYTGCSLYLKSGLGAGQISNIISYVGAAQLATVYPPFISYIETQLNNINGTFANDQIVSQQSEICYYLYSNGYFNVGDEVIQTDTGLYGYIYGANTAALTLSGIGNSTSMSVNLAIYNPSRVSNLGVNAFCSVGSNILITNSSSGSANLQSSLSVGEYIRIGNYPSPGNVGFYNTRRITSITNSSYANVDIPFAANSNTSGDLIYNVNSAVFPTSVTLNQTNGVIIQTNLTALTLTYANTQPNNSQFILGEIIKEYSNTHVDLGANGIVSFVNSSTLIISGVQGSFTIGNNIIGLGQTSNTSAIITNIINYPNITIGDVFGVPFLSGFPIFSYNLGNNISVGNAIPISTTYIPSTSVEYVVSPCVTITGDGSNAQAYSVVNTATGSLYNITNIVPLNVGENYTIANVTITAPVGYGSGAVGYPVISPVTGHGSDPISELGATSAEVAITIGTAQNELYKFPNYGSYRRIGLIKNPLFNDLTLNITTEDRNNLTLTGISAPFVNGEVVIQNSNTAGVVVNSNNTYMQLKNISGSFVNTGITKVTGLISNSTANVTFVNTLQFTFNNQLIYDANTTSNGTLIQVTNSSQIRLMSVGGKLYANDVIYDPTVNSYANVVSLYTANDTVNVTGTYGLRFNQTSRITLTSNLGAFIVGERVVQPLNQANGLLIDNSHELDVLYTVNNGVVSTGLLLTDTTSGANGIITYANSSYMKLTAVQGTFNSGDQYSFITGNGTINQTFPVLVVGDNYSPFETNQNPINGLTSGAMATSNVQGSIVFPDLIKNVGEILYINDISPFTLTPNTTETFQVVISF